MYMSAACIQVVNHFGGFLSLFLIGVLEILFYFFCSCNPNSIIMELFGSVCRDGVISADDVLRVS